MDEVKCVDCADWFGRCLIEKREHRLRLKQSEKSSHGLPHLAEGLS